MNEQSPLNLLLQAPPFVANSLPAGLRASADLLWLVLLGLILLVGLLLVLLVGWRLLRGKRGARSPNMPNLEERLADYPPAQLSSGDRRLTIEGVPVRLRLVVVAPSGDHASINPDQMEQVLDRLLPGLGSIYQHDKPRLRVWPKQLSYDGFARHFHRNTILPKGEETLSPWAILAGRARLGKQQVMLGFAMQAVKPNTVGRKTIDANQWDTVLRVRVREA